MKLLLIAIIAAFATELSAAESNGQKLILVPTSPNKSNPETETAPLDESDDAPRSYDGKYQLVEEFTANTLSALELKLGSELEVGLFDHVMVGSDTWSLILGIPTGHGKAIVYQSERHKVALGIKSVWLTLGNLSDFAPAKDHFRYLNAKVIRPSVAWTNSLSPRLKLHTFWAVRIGRVEAELSDKGRRAFWEAKHPNGNYDTRQTEVPVVLGDPDASTPDGSETPANTETTSTDVEVKSSKNQEKSAEKLSNISRRTLELQSLFGLSTDRFQITAEYLRSSGNKILFSTRIERMAMERLKANSLALTVAQQWIAGSFQFRLGIGLQYLSLTGRDLDGEDVDEAGINPVPQVAFYWRF